LNELETSNQILKLDNRDMMDENQILKMENGDLKRENAKLRAKMEQIIVTQAKLELSEGTLSLWEDVRCDLKNQVRKLKNFKSGQKVRCGGNLGPVDEPYKITLKIKIDDEIPALEEVPFPEPEFYWTDLSDVPDEMLSE